MEKNNPLLDRQIAQLLGVLAFHQMSCLLLQRGPFNPRVQMPLDAEEAEQLRTELTQYAQLAGVGMPEGDLTGIRLSPKPERDGLVLVVHGDITKHSSVWTIGAGVENWTPLYDFLQERFPNRSPLSIEEISQRAAVLEMTLTFST